MSEWRPIESAPKDGTEFQAWVVTQQAPNGEWWPVCRFIGSSFQRLDEDCVWVAMHSTKVTPTHWMPLPAPPADPKEEV